MLRSLGKFFGLAGLRVGFVVATEPEATAWRRPARGLAGVGSGLRDRDLGTARYRVDRGDADAVGGRSTSGSIGILGDAGLKLIGGTDLFGLFEAPDDVDLLDHFARAGILVRGFAAASQHYRFGLPADEAAWQRLEAACAR